MNEITVKRIKMNYINHTSNTRLRCKPVKNLNFSPKVGNNIAKLPIANSLESAWKAAVQYFGFA